MQVATLTGFRCLARYLAGAAAAGAVPLPNPTATAAAAAAVAAAAVRPPVPAQTMQQQMFMQSFSQVVRRYLLGASVQFVWQC